VLGAQDEASEIWEHLMADLRRAIVRSVRLKKRIHLWETDQKEVLKLR
jgi:hypothetical protein